MMRTDVIPVTADNPQLAFAVYRGFTKQDIRTMFYDGAARSFTEFLDLTARVDLHFWAIQWDNELIGMLYSSYHSNQSCMFHQGVFGRFRGITAVKAFREALTILGRTELYDQVTLIGVTPAAYPGAVKMAKLCGFKEVGKIPNMLYDVYDEVSMDAVLTYFIGGKADGVAEKV